MNTLAGDPNKTVVVFINDYYLEYANALPKLETILGRKLHAVVLVDARLKAQGLIAIDGPCRQVIADFSDDGALRRAVKTFEERLLLVASGSERNQPYLQRALPFMPYALGPTESSLTWATHKGLMRNLIRQFEPRLVPGFRMIESAAPAELARAMRRLRFPVILKPTGLASSILVSRADNAAELAESARSSFESLEAIYRRDQGRGNPAMLIEEFMVGDQYSVDAYVNEAGKVWTLPFLREHMAHTMGRAGFYEYQSDSHHDLTDAEQEAGRRAAEAAIHALGLRSSVAHIEMYLTADGWKIIELGARAGGQRQDFYFHSFGIDHALNEMLVKVGLEPDVLAPRLAYSTAIHIYADEEGTITALAGVDEARRHPSVRSFQLQAAPGQFAENSQKGGKWLVRALLSHPDRDQLYRDAETVRRMIKFQIEPVRAEA